MFTRQLQKYNSFFDVELDLKLEVGSLPTLQSSDYSTRWCYPALQT